MSHIFSTLWSRKVGILASDFLLPIVLFLIFLPFPQQWIVYAFVMVAFGHFNMALLYQYRGGKVTPWYLFVAITLITLGISYFVFIGESRPVFLLTIVMFGLHGAMDEFYLHSELMTWSKAITALCFVVIFSAISFIPFSKVFMAAIPITLCVAGVAFILRYLKERQLPSQTECHLMFVAALLMFFYFGAQVYTALGVLSLLHFIRWYIFYGMKLHGTSRARTYYIEILLFTVGGITLFVLYHVIGVQFLKYALEPVYYAAWAIWHFVLSSRYVSGPKKPLFGAFS